ncbi:hypothetical protein JAAARDRAFT_34363 [Jaapia argillacea MUCL 33604]|uniref:Transmembrane protein n=1 Tax=Jaapia argillacea MUCL 33604 TaxID=933084 RepID=A0A067Q7G4_9AGAM|nr:hypothetical protein JAAARDRAFT_34363 [Jaapia argillacea MUCL 33604]
MVDWTSPAELQKEALIFTKFMHVLLGLYVWEWFTSLDFDWDIISGKKKFRWPMIFYFGGRYCLLFAMVGIAIALDSTTPVNCQSLYTFNQLTGQATIGFASINLSIRTMAVWSQKRYIVIPLVVIILGHWSLILQGVLLTAVYVPGEGCAIVHTNNTVLSATFIYTMVFDLVITGLTAYKLVFNNPIGRSSLMNMIWGDGLIYFVIAFVANVLATTFMLLNLNPIMSVIFNVPAAVASTIVSTRAVRRLTNFTSKGAEVFSSGQNSGVNFRTGNTVNRGPTMTAVSMKKSTPGVHVQMETFTMAEGDSDHYDASGRKLQYDPEAQNEIGEEFKRPSY